MKQQMKQQILNIIEELEKQLEGLTEDVGDDLMEDAHFWMIRIKHSVEQIDRRIDNERHYA